jgi:hypothetical protein
MRAVDMEALTVKANGGLGELRWSGDGALGLADSAPSLWYPCACSQGEWTVEACEQRWHRWGQKYGKGSPDSVVSAEAWTRLRAWNREVSCDG